MVILHAGAKVKGRVLKDRIPDPTGLLKWLGDDRAQIPFKDKADIQARGSAFQAIIEQWTKHHEVVVMISPPEILSLTPGPAATIHLVIPCQDMGRHMDPAIQEVLEVLARNGTRPAGPMFSLHNRRPTDSFDFEIGFPVEKPVQEQGRVRNSTLPGVKVVRTVYQGPYDQLADAWRALQKWVRDQQLPVAERFWECYLNNPDEVQDPKEYLTELNWVLADQPRV
jgi:effector-binding domain-containing protein